MPQMKTWKSGWGVRFLAATIVAACSSNISQAGAPRGACECQACQECGKCAKSKKRSCLLPEAAPDAEVALSLPAVARPRTAVPISESALRKASLTAAQAESSTGEKSVEERMTKLENDFGEMRQLISRLQDTVGQLVELQKSGR